MDIVDGATDVPHFDEVDGTKLQLAVDDFLKRCPVFFSVEDHRRAAALSALDAIFAAPSGTKIPPFSAAAIGSVGHNIGTHGAVIVITAVGNENTENNAMPGIEITAHVMRSHVTVLDDKRELFEGWWYPLSA